MQLSCCQQTRALKPLECFKTQEEVAENLGVSVRTIQRLSVKAKEHSLNRHQFQAQLLRGRLLYIECCILQK